MIHLKSKNPKITRAFRIAIGDLCTNILPCNLGLIEGSADAAMAGLDYDFPWTRDAAINSWNGVSLIFPDVAKNTLLSMVEKVDGELRINHHQYWDAIVWATGAWEHYLYTGDKDFLEIALDATKNSLKYFEETECDKELCLFRGAAHTSDGTSSYPIVYRISDDENGLYSFYRFHIPDPVQFKTGCKVTIQQRGVKKRSQENSCSRFEN